MFGVSVVGMDIILICRSPYVVSCILAVAVGMIGDSGIIPKFLLRLTGITPWELRIASEFRPDSYNIQYTCCSKLPNDSTVEISVTHYS